MNRRGLIAIAAGFVLMLAGMGLAFAWLFCRVYVSPGECAVLTRKTGKALPADQVIAEAGEKGIQRLTLGPGRYFFNPLKWEIEKAELVTLSAGDPATWEEIYHAGIPEYGTPEQKGKLPEVGIVTSLAGKQWTGASEVVEKGYQGKWRQVLTPGEYRINPRAYTIEWVPAVVVPVGCCGVVTSQIGDMPGAETVTQTIISPDGTPMAGRPTSIQKLAEPGQRGVLRNVLPPGIYYLNPYVHKVRIVQIGYNLIGTQVLAQGGTPRARTIDNDPNGNAVFVQDRNSPLDGDIQSIEFPSKDGFTVEVEVTVVWGRHPRHTPELINRLGDVGKIRDLIIAQVRSICRNVGSEYISTDFIEGDKREQYQREVTETLKKVCEERDLEVLIALIHNIEVHASSSGKGDDRPADLKETIQRGFIAREQDLTRQVQKQTAMVKADLQTAEVQIGVAREQITADTRKKVAEVQAEGRKTAEQIDAQRDLDVAQIERKIADLEAETRRVLGKAEAEVARLKNEADAAGRRMMVEAFGSGSAFNLYTFAERFDPQSIRLIFAGPGTFWTDLSRLQDAASMELLQQASTPAVK